MSQLILIFFLVCPQYDGLDLMNTREHLSFYARVKGIKDVKRNVDLIMSMLGLTEQALTAATKLSGGNKRKLTLATALIGTPQILVLDEPTSAMDAVAKRSFWRAIHSIAPGRCILLTVREISDELLEEAVTKNQTDPQHGRS